ncbi:hypothetical protein AUC71_12175 [Methyloceanibacter marginalis]|uniref:Uncharacterized protein n=1 Tax=Methyloceanibacter marginalis TaxID=1774971 RepID=A0A1E3WB12_9HYPH|nr:hypothetical protein AUC71_12175 [Methyloceanibacter marginalis]
MTQERRGDGRHAARHAACRLCAFQRAHAVLEHGDGGIGVTAIDIAFRVALEPGLRLLGAVIDIAGVEEDGLGGLAELAAPRALVHELGGGRPGLAAPCLVVCGHAQNSCLCLRPAIKKTRTLAAAK